MYVRHGTPAPGACFRPRTELTQVSGTGTVVEFFVPNVTGTFGRVLRPYRTFYRGLWRVFTEQIPPVNCCGVQPQQTLPSTPVEKKRPKGIKCGS